MKHAAAGVFTADGDSLEPEAWRYVGDPGEPDFVDGSEAAATPLAALGGLRFYRLSGRVHVEGVAAITPPGVLFTLPAGYRPEFYVNEHHCESVSDDGMTSGEAAVLIAPDGAVGVTSADEANVSVRLDFRAA